MRGTSKGEVERENEGVNILNKDIYKQFLGLIFELWQVTTTIL